MSMNLKQARVVDPVLSTHVQGYRNAAFAGTSLFPSVPVTVSGGQVLEFGREAFRQYNSRRAPGAATKRIPLGYFGKPYQLSNHGLDAVVPRELARDAVEVTKVDLGLRAVDVTMRSLGLGLEIEQAAIARNPTSYPDGNKAQLSGASQWSADPDTAVDPSSSIDAGIDAIRNATGLEPNVMLLPSQVYRVLRRNKFARSLFGGTGAGALTPEQIATAYGIKRVVIGGAVYADGSDVSDAPKTGDFVDIWGKDVILAYVPEDPGGMEEPSFGYTYTLEGHPYVEPARWDGDTRSFVYGVSYERAPVLSGMYAGYLIRDVIA